MAQLGHTDAAFTLRVYAHAMRRDDGEKERLRALVEGRDWAQLGTTGAEGALAASSPEVPGTEESSISTGLADDGRGGFRTCDLSRVKREGVSAPLTPKVLQSAGFVGWLTGAA